MSSEEPSVNIDIMIIGDANVGKSNLVTRYVDDHFDEDSNPTIGADFF